MPAANSQKPTLAASLSVVFVAAFLVWMLRLHGALGLWRFEPLFRIICGAVGLLGVLPLAVLLIGKRVTRPKPGRWLPISVIILSSAAIGVVIVAFAFLNGVPFSPVGDISPHLVVSGTTGIHGIPDLAVVVYTRDHARENLTWGDSGSQSVIPDQSTTQQHVYMLRDLEPGTEYWYRFGNGFTHRFSTPVPGAALRFAVGSDAHFGGGDNRKDLTLGMLDHIASPGSDYDYFFSLGDLVELGFRDELWEDAMRSLSPNLSTMPAAFVAGNHDTLFTGMKRYLYFGYPPAIASDTDTALWRRFDVGDIHFLLLDLEWSAEAFSWEQAAWLEDQLMTISKDDWTIVLSHGFYYASGSEDDGWRWYDNPETIGRVTPLFEQYGVDLVFSGHNHQMELLQKAGVTYVIAGAFGGSPDAEREYVSPESVWYSAGQYGYADVTIDGDGAVVTFRDGSGAELNRTAIVRLGPGPG